MFTKLKGTEVEARLSSLKNRITLAKVVETDPVYYYLKPTISKEWIAQQKSKKPEDRLNHVIEDDSTRAKWLAAYTKTYSQSAVFDREEEAVEWEEVNGYIVRSVETQFNKDLTDVVAQEVLLRGRKARKAAEMIGPATEETKKTSMVSFAVLGGLAAAIVSCMALNQQNWYSSNWYLTSGYLMNHDQVKYCAKAWSDPNPIDGGLLEMARSLLQQLYDFISNSFHSLCTVIVGEKSADGAREERVKRTALSWYSL